MGKEKKNEPIAEVDYVDRNVVNIKSVPHVWDNQALTRLSLSHNKLTEIPPDIADLVNLEILTLWNNQITELPTSLSTMSRLKILNIGMNRLSVLPRGFGSFPSLEILDLTYNNLSEKSLPGNFFFICICQFTATLRALYLGDNDFEMLPGDVRNLTNLQILVLRDNDLLMMPRELGDLQKLRELHLQGNRLTTLPPELGALDLVSTKSVLRLQHNPWVPAIQEQLDARGCQGVWEYIRSENYKYFYGRQEVSNTPVPPKRNKDRKISRQTAKTTC